jgi:hypothetical protein
VCLAGDRRRAGARGPSAVPHAQDLPPWARGSLLLLSEIAASVRLATAWARESVLSRTLARIEAATRHVRVPPSALTRAALDHRRGGLAGRPSWTTFPAS